ncbi:MAG: Nif3-like dinuclear metal center hexameric protein [Clostridia bacterium]|nr:Nif3-like dinuclear metal center hexameric protein [Clostridia bacterium]
MLLRDFYNVLNEYAPKALSDEFCQKYGAYDNSGILVDTGKEVTKALFSLEFSRSAVQKAISLGADVLVTHHPAIYGKIGDIRCDGFSPLGEKLILCIQNGISVISMHLNLDGAQGGIDESLMQGVQLCASRVGAVQAAYACEVAQPLTGGGYGRVYSVANVPLDTLAKQMCAEFCTQRLLVYQNNDRAVTKAASFCGAGGDEHAVAFALAQGADVLISSDFRHHVLALAAEKQLSVIVLTHYAAENYGFKKYYEKIGQAADVACVYHVDENLL